MSIGELWGGRDSGCGQHDERYSPVGGQWDQRGGTSATPQDYPKIPSIKGMYKQTIIRGPVIL